MQTLRNWAKNSLTPPSESCSVKRALERYTLIQSLVKIQYSTVIHEQTRYKFWCRSSQLGKKRTSRPSCPATSKTGLSQAELQERSSSQAELGTRLRNSRPSRKDSVCYQAGQTWGKYLPSCSIGSAVEKFCATIHWAVYCSCIQHCDNTCVDATSE